jgi:hypothetical protein
MKNNDLEKLVLYKYQNDDGLLKVFSNRGSTITFRTIIRWYKMIRETIQLTRSQSCPRLIRTKGNIQKIKSRLTRVSSQRLAIVSEQTLKTVFSNEKMFDFDDMYIAQNGRV